LIVSVENLPPEGKTFPLLFSREEVEALLGGEDVGEVRAVAGLEGEVRALASGRDVFLLGRIQCRVEYQCVRCLEAFEEDVAAEFHRVFTEAEEGEAGEVELRREDLEVEPIRGGSIDLGQVVAEEIALALKAYPVCRESCQGLCPACGGNRNADECRCGGGPKDPRFAALAKLKK
jgi:uncharacterized protein